ncbi:MAG: DUF4199 domain-containing protein [Bacteroidia bacterium]|nr:DUF4199 domain-containing protein [Bacteroidia bacterium]
MKVDFKGASSCGLAVGLFGVVMSLITMYPLRTIVTESAMLSMLITLLNFAAFVLVLWYYKKHYAVGGAFTYGAGIKAGLAIGLFDGLITGAFMYCVFAFDQEYVNYIIEETKKQVAMMGLTPEMAQQVMSQMSLATNAAYQGVVAIFGTFLSALFYSLIAMIFLKEKEDYNSVMADVEDND